MSHDVRAVANFVLELAEKEGRKVTNLSINKIVFFLHSNYLIQFNRPLVSAKIEAWNYGPVFRELYKEFKQFGDQSIKGRAQRLSASTGILEVCELQLSEKDREYLERLARKYIRLSPGNLISLSHEKGGPWDQVWDHNSLSNATMRISDELIKAWHTKAARH